MRHVRDILRMYRESSLSQNQISNALGLSKGLVQKTLAKFNQSGIPWPIPEDITDALLESALYPEPKTSYSKRTPLPDFQKLEAELANPHVTIQMLFEEYQKETPKGLSRSRFYAHFNRHLEKNDLHLRMFRKGGDQLFVDYAGTKLAISPDVGVKQDLQVFLAVFGASGKAFAFLSASQSATDFIRALNGAIQFFGCVPQCVVPDNLKAAVLRAHAFDPTLHPLLQKWAEHYGTVILPARVRKPKDKALVENAVKHLGGYILGALRHVPMNSIESAQAEVKRLVDHFNDKPMQHYGHSRNERFESLDKPFAKALPETEFSWLSIEQGLRVGTDYHLRYRHNFYSVPFGFARQSVDIHSNGRIIEVYHEGMRIASHALPQTNEQGVTVTNPNHLPPHHLSIRFPDKDSHLKAAAAVGPMAESLMKQIYENAGHQELARRNGRHLLSLSKKVGASRLENACRLALTLELKHPRDLESMLHLGLDLEQEPKSANPVSRHENLRGKGAFSLNPNNTLRKDVP
jgi:transposase